MEPKIKKLKERQMGLFSSMAELLGGIASPVRIRLIHFLSQGPLTVEILASKIDQSVANTSMHLRKMLAQGIVSVSVRGQNRVYALHPGAFAFWEACQDFSQAVDPSLFDLESEEWPQDLVSTSHLARSKEITLLDVRPREEISESLEDLGVLHIPLGELKTSLAKIPKRRPVVVFCRGRFCAMSTVAVDELRTQGFKAYRLNASWYSLKTVS